MKLIISTYILLLAGFAHGQDSGFLKIESAYKKNIENHIVSNMPAVRSTDSIGICYASSTATILDAARCKENSKSGIYNCASMPDSEKVSQLDVARLGFRKDENDPNLRSYGDYKGLKEGGNGSAVLQTVTELTRAYATEACAPFNQIVNKSESYEENIKLVEGSWERLQKSFERYKSKEKECPTCATDVAATAMDDIKKDFNLKASNEQVLKAFAEDTYEAFLDKLLVPDECKNFRKLRRTLPNWSFKSYPPNGQKSNYDDELKVVKDTLKKDVPLQLGFCMDNTFKTMKDCKYGHSVVISGYRRICKDEARRDCRDALKIQNNWGQQWQNDNDDGWVDAKVILDRTGYSQNNISWLEMNQ